MADKENFDLPLNGKIVAIYLILGSLGAIIMSWISYSAMIGRAL